MSARTTPARTAPRDARIEALRLVAIASIAVFHTFQPWFATATDGSWPAGAPTLWALGMISLLGAFGNHVFFMVSGLFLVPQAAHAAHEPDYWLTQARRTARRAATILASVILYAALALAVNAWIVPVDGVGLNKTWWILGGLEFIWVYLVLVAATPVMGWVWARVRNPEAVVGVLTVAVFALNAYIAFVSPGEAERGLLEWRKLMSAVSYLVAYLVGGTLGARRTRLLALSDASEPDNVRGRQQTFAEWRLLVFPDIPGHNFVRNHQQNPKSRGARRTRLLEEGHDSRPGPLGSPWPLAVALAVSATVEAVAAGSYDLGLLAALSFKSTSVLSFALATGTVCAVAGPHRNADRPSRAATAVRWLTPAILGYYIAQSMFAGLWRPAFEGICAGALDAGGPLVFLATGVVVSVALLVVILVVDRLVRVNLLRQVHLS